jgi:hypothetical protein
MTQPLCRYCAGKIAKRTTTVRFVVERKSHMRDDQFTSYVIGHPMTKAEAQRLVNQTVVSVRHDANPWGDMTDKYVTQASVWDGESYVDPYFCNGACRSAFAVMVCRDRPDIASKSYFEAKAKAKAEKEHADA